MNNSVRRSIILNVISFLFFTGIAHASCDLVPIKNQNFGGLELIRACSILPFTELQPGGPDICAELPVTPPQEPLVNLVAQDMLYFNWEIPAANVPLLESALGLADRGFRMAPIEIIRGESPKYYMSLNFYTTFIAGVLNYRSEWSIYVAKGDDPRPRYMVVEVHSSEDTADPTFPGFINPGTEVTYTLEDRRVQVSNPDFQASFNLPGPGKKHTAAVGWPWAEANDALYWINGLADSALYNGGLLEAPLIAVNPRAARIDNSSDWSAFLPQKPDNIVLFPQPLEFAFTPYFNLMDPSLGLPAWYTEALQGFKNFTFGAFSYGHAFQVLQGIEEPLLRFDVLSDNVPSVFINFNIPGNRVRALEAALDLPAGFKLARSKMTQRQPVRYLLTLNIYETPDVLTGERVYRAEWSVYVRDGRDPTAKGRYLMVIDVDSNGASLNPVDLFTPPTVFDYSLQQGKVSADIKAINDDISVSDKFYLEFDLPAESAPAVRLHEEWILSNDRVYWRNGVYDLLFYNGLLLDADAVEADLESVVIDDQTPWADYVDARPVQIVVFRNPLQFVLHPWYNVEERCLAP